MPRRAASSAPNFDFVIGQTQSSSSMNADLTTDLATTVIGDYDSATNPGGTRLTAGLFGGGPNDTIPVTMSIDNLGAWAGASSGVFSMSLNQSAMTMSVSGTDVDMMNGSTGTTSVDVTLLFSTFRSWAPDSLYVGGIPFSLPLGDINITGATAVQTGPSTLGVLIPGTGGIDYTFTASVPVLLTMTGDFNGTAIPIPPFAMVMPIFGALTLTGTGATASAGFNYNNQTVMNDPFPGYGVTDAPVGLPTILPPGFVANVLMSGTVDAIDWDIQLDLNLVADGTPGSGGNCNVVFCDTDLNNIGDITLSA